MKKKWIIEMSQAPLWSAADNREFSPLPYLLFSFQHDNDGMLIIFGWLFWQWYAWKQEMRE